MKDLLEAAALALALGDVEAAVEIVRQLLDQGANPVMVEAWLRGAIRG